MPAWMQAIKAQQPHIAAFTVIKNYQIPTITPYHLIEIRSFTISNTSIVSAQDITKTFFNQLSRRYHPPP